MPNHMECSLVLGMALNTNPSPEKSILSILIKYSLFGIFYQG